MMTMKLLNMKLTGHIWDADVALFPNTLAIRALYIN